MTNKMTGTELFARFGFPGCQRELCGLSTPETLRDLEIFINSKGRKEEAKIKILLKTFITVYYYCRLIAKANSIVDAFNFGVVEAYFLGNELLEKVDLEEFKKLLDQFRKIREDCFPEIPDSTLEKLRPTHAFDTLAIKTGKRKFPRTLEEKDSCRTTLCEVKKTKDKKLVVEYQPLVLEEDKILLGKPRLKEIEKGFCQRVKKGSWIFSHLDFAVTTASKKQMENAEKYLRLTLDVLNGVF